jgi:hypothetical protein
VRACTGSGWTVGAAASGAGVGDGIAATGAGGAAVDADDADGIGVFARTARLAASAVRGAGVTVGTVAAGALPAGSVLGMALASVTGAAYRGSG